ncbi:MAG: hypothetical protein ABW139_06555 [Candidatus Thiodiazotropha sp. DIVDIV]
MKNLLILIIVIVGIMMVGTYLRPDETRAVKEQTKTQLQALAQGAADSIQHETVPDEITVTDETIEEVHQSTETIQDKDAFSPQTITDDIKHGPINISGELPVPPVDEVISPTNEITTASAQHFKHQDQYTHGDVLQVTRRNEERFQQLFDKYNLD